MEPVNTTVDQPAAPAGVGAQLESFTRLPMKQLGLIIGLAAALGVIAILFMWSQEPTYKLLYSNLSDQDAGKVLASLQESKIPYKLDQVSGAIKVPTSHVHETRLKLAAEGLPQGSGVGFEQLSEPQGFGVSQFIEKARFQRALEVELARSVMTLNPVKGARVHLATPKQSVFVRKQKKPSVSVLVDLYQGRTLTEGQVAAIAHMVSSSVPNLELDRVTVIDQNGRLLTSNQNNRAMALTSSQFDYTRKLEEAYIERIENILAPIAGMDSVRAQVVADIDFTVTEQTQEIFNPDTPSVRSRQSSEELNQGMDGGIPGALSNQPPGAAQVPEVINAETASTAAPSNSRRQSTLNYELDKTISHTRQSMGRLRRLSVAVVIDNKTSFNEAGIASRSPYSPENMERMVLLVKEAVGFNVQRGDSVSVMNNSFAQTEPLPELALTEEVWFRDLLKQGGVALVILLVVLMVIRPLLKSLSSKDKDETTPSFEAVEKPFMSEDDILRIGEDEEPELVLRAGEFGKNVDRVRELAESDPKLVAQVIRGWVLSDTGGGSVGVE